VKPYLAAAVALVLILGMFLQIPSAEAKVTVHSVTVTTDKSSYTIGSEAIATAVLDFTGNKKQLQPVDFTWYYPNGTIAKSDPSVTPDGKGTAYSAFTTDFVGNGYTVNATYSGDVTIFDEVGFDVVPAPPSNMVSGEITVDTTWTRSNSPYIVLDNVSVENGVTLTIEPGVVVEFKDITSLTVNGTLIAEGNQTNMITFTSNNSNPQPGDWDWINFNEASDASSIRYCRIEYCYYGINIFQCSPDVTYNLIRDVLRDGIRAYESSSFIGYNTITEIVHSFVGNKGINLLGFCDTTIEGNVVTQVEEYGIKVTDSNPIITQNYISGSYYNIDCYNSDGTISNNTLDDAEIAGIRLRECADIFITNNTIQGSARKGIESDWSSPTISGNVILENGGTGLDDSGIYLYKSEGAVIIDNYLEENINGIYSKNSNFSHISRNQVINSTEDGFYADNSNEIELESNVINGNENGLYVSDSINFSSNGDSISNSIDKGVYLYNTTGFRMEKGTIFLCGNGTYLHSSEAILTNCTIPKLANNIFYLTQNSILISINYTFSDSDVQVLGGCQLIVRNYLHIFVENESYLPFKGANIEIRDGDVTIYSTQTGDDGFCRFLLFTDRIFDGSSNPTDNVTAVEVYGGDTNFVNNPREVYKSSSHLEIFSPGNPLSLEITYPAELSLIFSTVNITGNASSKGSKIITVEIRVGEDEWDQATETSDDWATWHYEMNTTLIPDGWYFINARALTTHHEYRISLKVFVDNIGNKPPAITLTSHATGDEVNGTIILEGTAFDYDGVLEYVEVKIDMDEFNRAQNPNGNWSIWNMEIDTTAYPNGTHNVSIKAMDNSSESMIIRIELVFVNEVADNGDGEEDGNGEENGDKEPDFSWLIILVIVVIIALLLIVTMLKKRKKANEDEDTVEENEEFE
jgi:parallel beta-helix repeat protein